MSQEQALALAARMISFGRGSFDLGLIGVSIPADERWLLDALVQRLRSEGLSLLRLPADALGSDPLGALYLHDPADAIAVYGLHAGHVPLFHLLNIQRDRLAAARPVPWLMLGHPVGIRALVDHAPDFVDFASFREVEPAGQPDAAGIESSRVAEEASWGEMGETLRDRMWLEGNWEPLAVLLHQDLRERPDDPTAKLRRAKLHERRGEFDEALRLLKKAVDGYERLGDVRERAVT